MIAGFGVAVASAKDNFAALQDLKLADQIKDGLKKISKEIIVFGADAASTGTAICFAIPGLKNNISMINYDLENIALSAGSACSSGKVSRSHVLSAMGIDQSIADCALRVSVGWNSTRDDIERFLAVTAKIVARHQSKRGDAA